MQESRAESDGKKWGETILQGLKAVSEGLPESKAEGMQHISDVLADLSCLEPRDRLEALEIAMKKYPPCFHKEPLPPSASRDEIVGYFQPRLKQLYSILPEHEGNSWDAKIEEDLAHFKQESIRQSRTRKDLMQSLRVHEAKIRTSLNQTLSAFLSEDDILTKLGPPDSPPDMEIPSLIAQGALPHYAAIASESLHDALASRMWSGLMSIRPLLPRLDGDSKEKFNAALEGTLKNRSHLEQVPAEARMIWLHGKRGEKNPLPSTCMKNIKGFLEQNPECPLELWSDNVDFVGKCIEKQQPSLLQKIELKKIQELPEFSWTGVTDQDRTLLLNYMGNSHDTYAIAAIYKALLLNQKGGIVQDLDIESLKALPSITTRGEMVLNATREKMKTENDMEVDLFRLRYEILGATKNAAWPSALLTRMARETEGPEEVSRGQLADCLVDMLKEEYGAHEAQGYQILQEARMLDFVKLEREGHFKIPDRTSHEAEIRR